MIKPTNKTLAVEIEDFKTRLIEALWQEEQRLWHGSEREDAGWNNAITRAVEVVRETR